MTDLDPAVFETNDERLASLQNRTYNLFNHVIDVGFDLFDDMSTQNKTRFILSALPALSKLMTVSESDEIAEMRKVVAELQKDMRERLIA